MAFDEYGFNLIKNEDWENRWLDTVTSDFDYDGEFLIRLIAKKLKYMLDYFKCIKEKIIAGDFYTDKNIDIIIEEITFCSELADNILNFNYAEEADILFKEKGTVEWLTLGSDTPDYTRWKELSKLGINERQKDIEKLFNKLGKKVNNWWC